MINKITISNILISLSLFFTAFTYIDSDVYNFGMNSAYLNQGLYHYYFLQFFTSNFIHGGLLHLLMNSFFIFFFGNIVEEIIGKKRFIFFFLFTVFFIGILLTIFVPYQNTIGISGFALALLTYYTLELKSQGNPEYTGGITAIIINIGIGFVPGISLYGHAFGVIAGAIFYFFIKNFFSKQEIGFIYNYKKFIKKIPKAMPENIKKDEL